MGTRSSRHNKGRKPIYKEHGGKDSLRHFTLEIAPKRRSQQLVPIVKKRQAIERQVELEATVTAFLARRQAAMQPALPEASAEIDFRLAGQGTFETEIADKLVDVSQRDILLQLFVERKITAGQLHAGRVWQRYKEGATIQPNRSIDWSGEYRGYQPRGDLTESQYFSMKQRQLFMDAVGTKAVSFLDFCLDADKGRAAILRALTADADKIEDYIGELLISLCDCYGLRAWTYGQLRVWQGGHRNRSTGRNAFPGRMVSAPSPIASAISWPARSANIRE